jgi:hypothetical protein
MPEYANVDGWSVRVDESLNNGCFVATLYEGDTLLRIGFDRENNNFYALFGDPLWKSIEYGKKYNVEIKFGNESKWTAIARGMSFEPPQNEHYLWVNVGEDSDQIGIFLDEFMRETSVKLFYNEEIISHLKLKGSYAAGMKLLECQKLMNNQAEKDPFSTPGVSSGSDPFET